MKPPSYSQINTVIANSTSDFWCFKARFYVTVITQTNKSMVPFSIRRNVPIDSPYSKYAMKSGLHDKSH